MCYSAMVEQKLKRLERLGDAGDAGDAKADIPRMEELFRRRLDGEDIKVSKAFELNFLDPRSPGEQRIADCIKQYQDVQEQKWQAELFKQRKRLADAERQMAKRHTKKAENDLRVAGNKVEWLLEKLANVRRTQPKFNDERIYPFWYAPVVVEERGERLIRPMRYHLRTNGKPASYDRRYPGLYNARRDNLEGYWKNLFGQQQAVCVVKSFYENVALHDFEKRELRPDEKAQNLILHFNPQPMMEMLVACLWDRWQKKGEPDLYSFAAITDEPPPEVAATGHNRCIIPLKLQNLSAWLTPGGDLGASYALLDNRERPYYAHEMAA